MKTKVWNLELPPFPREGLNPTMPLEECPVTRLMRTEAARLERLNQFDPPRNLKELKKFQQDLRATIWEKLGAKPDSSLPLKPEFLGDIKKDDEYDQRHNRKLHPHRIRGRKSTSCRI